MAAFQHAPSRKSIAREQGKDWDRVKVATAVRVANRMTPKSRTVFIATTIPKRSWKYFLTLLFKPKPKEEVS